MELSANEYLRLVREIARETGAKRDGTGKNLIVPRCPFCGKTGGKFGYKRKCIFWKKVRQSTEPYRAIIHMLISNTPSISKIDKK